MCNMRAVSFQTENVAAYSLAVEFIKKTSSFLEPYIQLV